MPTIADEIRAWARTNIQGAAVMTRNTDAYNHMTEAVAKLTAMPWAQKDAAYEPSALELGAEARRQE